MIDQRDQIHLRAGASRATIDVARGGRLASWAVAGRELLVGPPSPDDRSIRWGLFLMAPWAGRLAGARFRWGDTDVRVPRTHGRHAIHGLLWDRSWAVETAGEAEAVLACELRAGRWPIGGRIRHAIRLEPDRLVLQATITASSEADDEASHPAAGMPVAIGWHPWFARGDDVALRVDADSVLETTRMIPTGHIVPVAGRTDLRRGPRLGRRRLDHAFVDARSPATVRLGRLELTIEFEPSPATVVVHSPPGSLCVEPQTSWPDALRLAAAARDRAGLRVLSPGESFVATMTIRWG